MTNTETLDYETKIYALICGLWSLDLSEPTFSEKIDDYGLSLINKKQNLGTLKFKFVKFLYQRCKKSQSKENAVELVHYLKKVMRPQISVELQTLLNRNKSSYYREEIRIDILNNYIRRFNFFYLQYFNNIPSQYNTQRDLNTLAIWALFFLLL